MRWRVLWVCVPMVVAGCVPSTRPSTTPSAEPPAKVAPGRFEQVDGRGADLIAELRAAPAKSPEFIDSNSAVKDEQTLSAKGYVKVADGYYAGIDADANAWLQKQGKAIGADKVYFYTVEPDAQTKAPSLHAVYYVRFKLPFGASFRDLNPTEREQVGASGVRIGKVIGGSPAADANLRGGDIVLKIGTESIAGRTAFEKLLRNHMGKRVTLTISRNGNVTTRLVRLGVLASELNKSH
ncbi:MAG TPA: PDZ domain-containing protein [Rudaea sp.]|jgi:C-terminal processing protease CtpA/Prc|nr:PDZ domain-containing protein [Rudaea sp.]